MRDIEENPLRIESVKRKEDYGWSSARAHILGMSHDLFPDETRFHEKKSNQNGVTRRAISIGRPLGIERFIKKLEGILVKLQIPEPCEKRYQVIDYEFSEHAYEMMKERNIQKDWVKLAIEDPERKEQMDDGTVHYIKAID